MIHASLCATSRRAFLRSARLSILATVLAVAVTGPSLAQSPTVVRWIVPFAAGSYTDNVARIIAPGIASPVRKTTLITQVTW